jgi:hypothetical protein
MLMFTKNGNGQDYYEDKQFVIVGWCCRRRVASCFVLPISIALISFSFGQPPDNRERFPPFITVI